MNIEKDEKESVGFTASEALKITQEVVSKSLSLNKIFDLIEDFARGGSYHIVVDRILDKDIPYLQELGYKLYRKTNGKLLISWK